MLKLHLIQIEIDWNKIFVMHNTETLGLRSSPSQVSSRQEQSEASAQQRARKPRLMRNMQLRTRSCRVTVRFRIEGHVLNRKMPT